MTTKKPKSPAPTHACGRLGCRREVAITVQHRILGTDDPQHVCFCLEDAPDLVKVMPSLIEQMMGGSLEEIRVVSTAKLAQDVEGAPLVPETDEEVDSARKAAIAAYLRLIGPEGELGALLGHHSDNAVLEAFATLTRALFRHGYLGMAGRAFDQTWWTRVMSIGLVRALAHGKCPPKERLEVARGFVESAERLMKYKFEART